ncbi:hypothetical protein HDU79_009247 [Rhizoclosmatium sp. JEL0117]|nr:hypothetical protein HDU79_009247 [Rhizoclosmatium sp. JEL0117]
MNNRASLSSIESHSSDASLDLNSAAQHYNQLPIWFRFFSKLSNESLDVRKPGGNSVLQQQPKINPLEYWIMSERS